jgi:hypothetical protein
MRRALISLVPARSVAEPMMGQTSINAAMLLRTIFPFKEIMGMKPAAK